MAEIKQSALAARFDSIELAKPLKSESSRAVLVEIFELLEEYAPTWYPEDLHNRAVSALWGPRKIDQTP